MALDLKNFKPESAEDLFKSVLGEISEDGKKWWDKTQDTIADHLKALTVSVMRTRQDLKDGKLTRKEAQIVFRAAQTSFETVVPFTRYLTAVLAQRIVNTVVSAVGWAVFNLTG
ncbi:MAG: hypothetical protein AB8B47_03875, partial [Roseobacter sp.]